MNEHREKMIAEKKQIDRDVAARRMVDRKVLKYLERADLIYLEFYKVTEVFTDLANMNEARKNVTNIAKMIQLEEHDQILVTGHKITGSVPKIPSFKTTHGSHGEDCGCTICQDLNGD